MLSQRDFSANRDIPIFHVLYITVTAFVALEREPSYASSPANSDQLLASYGPFKGNSNNCQDNESASDSIAVAY